MTGLHRIMLVQSLRASSGTVPAKVAGEQHRFPDVFCPGQLHQNALNTETPTGVGGYAVPESRHVKLEFIGVEVHGSQVLHEHVDAVFSLASGGHFIPAEIEVKTS
jgi:hypothetical protein